MQHKSWIASREVRERLRDREPPPGLKSPRCLADVVFSTNVLLSRGFVMVMAGGPSRVLAVLGLCGFVLPEWKHMWGCR